MELKIKLCIFIGATTYLFFLGWYFGSQNNSSGIQWYDADKNTTFNTTTFAAGKAPVADGVFDSKLKVKMKKVSTIRRKKISMQNHHNIRRNKSFSTSKYFYTQRNFAISPVGEAIHSVSNSKFTSFGAWGLMGTPNQNHSRLKYNQQNRTNNSTVYYISNPIIGTPLPLSNNPENQISTVQQIITTY